MARCDIEVALYVDSDRLTEINLVVEEPEDDVSYDTFYDTNIPDLIERLQKVAQEWAAELKPS